MLTYQQRAALINAMQIIARAAIDEADAHLIGHEEAMNKASELAEEILSSAED